MKDMDAKRLSEPKAEKLDGLRAQGTPLMDVFVERMSDGLEIWTHASKAGIGFSSPKDLPCTLTSPGPSFEKRSHSAPWFALE